jgi:hypothetical protein
MNNFPPRRGFLRSLGAAGTFLSGSALKGAQASTGTAPGTTPLPNYARLQDHRTLKQSSYDRTGGNADAWPIEPGQTRDVFQSDGPGVITHIWFTISAKGEHHLKELVMRIYWDGNAKPSVETPVGDFFGLNLGEYFLYQSAFLNCSSVKALNSYFAMPFRRSARIAITNDGQQPVGSFYSNIDYKLVSSLPSDALYFHAQYRQAAPDRAAVPATEINPDGRNNYVFFETRGKGQAMGVTLGVIQNAENWFGEGDEMIFIDDNSKPVINGTGTEDYFCGAWDFGGRNGAIPFANLYNGAPYVALPEHTDGRYCLYRWHADNPIVFQRSLKFTIEHGHADDRSDNYYSVGYWYQSEPFTDFPALPPVAERIPVLKMS